MNRQKIQIIPLFLFLTLVSGVLVFLDQNRITDPVRSFFEYHMLKIRGKPAGQQTKNEELEAKIISLENERDDLSDENRLLRKQLQAPLPPSYEFIPAKILSKSAEDHRALFLISSGLIDGVSKDMPVVSEQILIGRITAVTPRMAHVQLLSDANSSVAVKTSTGARGIVFGVEELDSRTFVEIDRILQSEPLETGDIVETSGEDGLPPDLLIGTVQEIITQPRDPFQKARVELTIDPAILERVFVVKIE